MFDIAIIGAGLAGLTCAQQLQQAGYHVVILEKSRGVGGRIATRRLQNTCADHGVRYLESRTQLLSQLIERLQQQGILTVWPNTIYELQLNPSQSALPSPTPSSPLKRYIAPAGMTAVAKFLAKGLNIWRNCRVERIKPTASQTWHLILDSSEHADHELTAKAIVIAIPAPQALILLEPLLSTGLSSEFLDNLRSVTFDPCLSVMAGYRGGGVQELPLPDWNACTLSNDLDLAWIGLDSSKRPDPQQPIFVLQSTAQFAQQYLDAPDLNSAGQQLLSRAAQLLIPWLNAPDWFQVHRWRFAFPHHFFNQDCIAAEIPLPLICCGDWCGGNFLESALHSGLAAAVQMNQQLQQRSLPGNRFLDTLSF